MKSYFYINIYSSIIQNRGKQKEYKIFISWLVDRFLSNVIVIEFCINDMIIKVTVEEFREFYIVCQNLYVRDILYDFVYRNIQKIKYGDSKQRICWVERSMIIYGFVGFFGDDKNIFKLDFGCIYRDILLRNCWIII